MKPATSSAPRRVVDLFVERPVDECIELALRRKLLFDDEEELLQASHPSHCAVSTHVGGMEKQHHQLFDSRGVRRYWIESECPFGLLGLPLDELAGEAVVWLAQLVSACLESIEDRLIQLDVELFRLRLGVRFLDA